MLSRVADLIYWLARHLERAENTARIVDVNAALALDLQSRRAADDPKSWEPLIRVSGGDELFDRLYGRAAVTEENVVNFMVFDRRNPSSILSCVNLARENARCIRDQLSTEVWEQLNTVYLKLKDEGYADYQTTGSADYTNRLKQHFQLFHGVADSMLPRNQAWWFFKFGRFLERADNVSRIIDVKYFTLLPEAQAVGSALDIIQWAAVLRSCSGFEAFRKSRRGQITLDRVVDYLVLDPDFPRSIRYSVSQAEAALRQITLGQEHLDGNRCTALVGRLRAGLEAGGIGNIIAAGLHEYLDTLQYKVGEIHTALQETFIEYPTAGAKVLA